MNPDRRPRAHCEGCGRLVIVPATVVLEGIEAGEATWRYRGVDTGVDCDACCTLPVERYPLRRERIAMARDPAFREDQEMARHAYAEWARIVHDAEEDAKDREMFADMAEHGADPGPLSAWGKQ